MFLLSEVKEAALQGDYVTALGLLFMAVMLGLLLIPCGIALCAGLIGGWLWLIWTGVAWLFF